MTAPATILDVSPDVLAIEDRMKAAKIGEVITYAEIAKLVGRDVQFEDRYLIQSARRRCLRNHRMVFAPVRGVGLKRLDDEGIINQSESGFRRLRRIARNECAKQLCVTDFEKLSREARVKQSAALAVFGTIAMFGKRKSIEKIEARVSAEPRRLSYKETLALFNGTKRAET